MQRKHRTDLWIALVAITNAIEDLDLEELIDQYRSSELGLGAWEFARAMIDKHDDLYETSYLMSPDKAEP